MGRKGFPAWTEKLSTRVQALATKSSLSTAYYKRGVDHFREGNYDSAIQAFTEAIRHDPKDAKAHRNRGVAYTRKGAYDRAIQDHTEAIRLNPNDSNAYRNRGSCLHAQRRV